MDKIETVEDFKKFLSNNREKLLNFAVNIILVKFGGYNFHIQIKMKSREDLP